MSSRKNKPIFNREGICIVEGFRGRNFELGKKTWEDHILKDNGRWHLKEQFAKVVETLKRPDYILRSPSENYVASYIKLFNDLYLLDTVLATAYLYVFVNLNTNIIRMVYDNPKLKRWERIWPKK